MALIKCPECGKEISDKANACPNCGNPINVVEKKEETPESYLCCPKCGSRDLHAEQKGFSGGKALVGAVTFGGLGLLAGTIGSKDVQITCLKCGKQFKAGEAGVYMNDASKKALEERLKQLIIQNPITNDAISIYQKETGCSHEEACEWYKNVKFTEEEEKKFKENVNNYKGGCASVIVLLIVLSSVLATFL